MNRYSPFVRVEVVDSYDHTHKRRMQWAVRLEIGGHKNAHSQYVVIRLSGKVQTIFRSIRGCAVFRRQSRVERANANRLHKI